MGCDAADALYECGIPEGDCAGLSRWSTQRAEAAASHAGYEMATLYLHLIVGG